MRGLLETAPNLSEMPSVATGGGLRRPVVLRRVSASLCPRAIPSPPGLGGLMRKCLRCPQPAILGTSRCEAHRLRRSRWALYPSNARYRSAEWSERRRKQLAENPTCALCGQPATVADHITAVKLGGDWDGPLQSLCKSCSQKKSSSEGG